MKKGIAFILSFLFCLLPVTALAADTTGETQVSYTYTKSASTYEINIPNLIYLQNEQSITLTANTLNLQSGEKVVAYIDGSKSFSGGKLNLTSDNGSSVLATVYRRDRDDNTESVISPQGETYLTEFDMNGEMGDSLRIVPNPQANTPSGTYTAAVHFILRIETA